MGHQGGARQEGGEDAAAVHQQQNGKQNVYLKGTNMGHQGGAR
jgi:hypothetical protein